MFSSGFFTYFELFQINRSCPALFFALQKLPHNQRKY